MSRNLTTKVQHNLSSSPLSKGDSLTHDPSIDTGHILDNRFLFQLDKYKNINFNVLGCNIPGLNLAETINFNPLKDVPFPGDKLEFEPLIIRYKIDGKFENYLMIQRWVRGLGFPEGSYEHQHLDSEMLDASISIPVPGCKNEMLRIHFQNCFPTSVESIEFDATSDGLEITSTVTFLYQHYTINRIPVGELDNSN